jgi:serine phosphatase RsbU (regulator of sigma subunit)
VPGAFMSMIGYEMLNEITNVLDIAVANEILYYLNLNIRKSLKQDETNNKDGMDIALCVIDKTKQVVEYAGAKNSLMYLQNNELFEVKADKIPIGGDFKDNGERIFTNNFIYLNNIPTTIYLFTDGYQDQFGGENNLKFSKKRMRELFLTIHTQDMEEQKTIIANTIENWKGDYKQIDDILMLGIRI